MFYKKTSESGRSMIEMLGVLAIIGFLSIIILYGFKYAIFRYRVNQTLTQISTMVAGARTLNLDQLNLSDDEIFEVGDNWYIPAKYVISNVHFKENDPYHIVTPLNAEIAVYQDGNGVWKTEINYTDRMDFGDCRALILSPVAENGVAWNGKVYTQQDLKEDEKSPKAADGIPDIKKICDDLTQKNS
ncbi:MAG: type II secretion system protein [Alphaproteobacteria bacterium]|nr:type II secretion system protein [Alphaproteobacteria bacterium]